MPNYSLRRVSDGNEWSVPATNKHEALERFCERLNKNLTFDDPGRPNDNDYSMVEQEEQKEPTSPYWRLKVWELPD